MYGFAEKKVGVVLGISFICLFADIYFAISYYAIDNHLKEFGDAYYDFYYRLIERIWLYKLK